MHQKADSSLIGRAMSRYLLPVWFFALLFAQQLLALEIRGSVSQGGLLLGKVSPAEKVEFMNRQVRVSAEGWFVVGLGRNAPEEVELRVHSPDGESASYRFQVIQRQYKEDRVEGVPQKTVTPPPEVLERIRQEAALVRQARADDEQFQYFLAGFRKPAEGRISGVYGSRRVYNGTPGRPHYGLDIAAPTGTPVYAPASGVVKLVHDDMFYSGGTLVIDHGHGLTSTFIHLSEVLARPGEHVDSGELIARIGASGRATGPHLDWRINWFDVRLDPALVLQYFPPENQP